MPDRTTLPPRQLLIGMAAVVTGGACGTGLRYAAVSLEPHPSSGSWLTHVPYFLLVLNVIGVCGATWALRRPLHHREPNDRWRLLVITGFFGGFTSYSSLVLALAGLWRLSALGALATGCLAVLSGSAAAWLTVRWTKR